MSNYVSFYVSQDFPTPSDGTATWSVYSEQYVHADDEDPIDGSQVLVESGLPSERDADRRASELWRAIHQDHPNAQHQKD